MWVNDRHLMRSLAKNFGVVVLSAKSVGNFAEKQAAHSQWNYCTTTKDILYNTTRLINIEK
jgi:hypothetical protein